MCDLLVVCKAAVQEAENEQIKKQTLSSAKHTAESYLALLSNIGDVSFLPFSTVFQCWSHFMMRQPNSAAQGTTCSQINWLELLLVSLFLK